MIPFAIRNTFRKTDFKMMRTSFASLPLELSIVQYCRLECPISISQRCVHKATDKLNRQIIAFITGFLIDLQVKSSHDIGPQTISPVLNLLLKVSAGISFSSGS
ncbi:hypothetical protein D3C73_942400 [compost metagenome]